MMKKFNLETLKTITPPLPSDEAKKKALENAQMAFDDACQEKNQTTFQGKEDKLRLIHSFSQKLWRQMMKKYVMTGAAISGLAAAGFIFMTYDKKEAPLPQASQEEAKLLADNITSLQGYNLALNEAPSMALGYDSTHSSTRGIITLSDDITDDKLYVDTAMDAEIALSKNISGYVQTEELKAAHPLGGNRDTFTQHESNPVKQVKIEPVSTFSVDVDTASYAYMRSALNNGTLPSQNAVRTEELINYFDYDYALPQNAKQPFKPNISIYPTPWNKDTKLLHIGIKGYDVIPTQKPPANLTFLIDTSGSMNAQNKLVLLKNAFAMMVENLEPYDTVSLVAYAGNAGIVLEPTKVQEKNKILNALDNLQAGGSTAGGEGIKLAYSLAEENFDDKAINRVILATDGDFNVGISDTNELKDYIKRKRETGVFLSVLGFGRGNYNDELMQALAQNGNGNAAYIDNLGEARKILVEEASATLFPIAKDVKIQMEFNPQQISEYRLIGYETRALKQEDFNNDKVDAGDIGSGHSVTAIYEITPIGSKAQLSDDLRYQNQQNQASFEEEIFDEKSSEYGFLKIRYKLPSEDKSRLIEYAITANDEHHHIQQTHKDIRFSTAVAAFAQLLKNEDYIKDYSYDDVIELAQSAKGDDIFGYRSEFINLVRLAQSAKRF